MSKAPKGKRRVSETTLAMIRKEYPILDGESRKDYVIRLASLGLDYRDVAEVAGISPTTIRVWMFRDAEFFRKWHKITKVSANYWSPQAIARIVEIARAAESAGDYKAARRAWRDVLEVSGAAGWGSGPQSGGLVSIGEVNLDLRGLSLEQLLEALRELSGSKPVIDVSPGSSSGGECGNSGGVSAL